MAAIKSNYRVRVREETCIEPHTMRFIELENSDSKADDQVSSFVLVPELSLELRLGILIYPGISDKKRR